MIKEAIEQYARGGPQLAAAIAGLEKHHFLAYPIPNTWSIQQIAIHLMDSDLVSADRMKRIIAEENPPLLGYDESLFSQRLYYDKLDPFLAAEIFEKNRIMMTVILQNLPEQAFKRFGSHNQRGQIALDEMVGMYVQHLDHHLKFLRHKRQLLGK